jgi:hypothetical protein
VSSSYLALSFSSTRIPLSSPRFSVCSRRFLLCYLSSSSGTVIWGKHKGDNEWPFSNHQNDEHFRLKRKTTRTTIGRRKKEQKKDCNLLIRYIQTDSQISKNIRKQSDSTRSRFTSFGIWSSIGTLQPSISSNFIDHDRSVCDTKL